METDYARPAARIFRGGGEEGSASLVVILLYIYSVIHYDCNFGILPGYPS